MILTFDFEKYQSIIQPITEKYAVANIPLQVFNSLDSTNNKLWELIELGNQIPLSAIAIQQTAGKGQWGKTWESEQGGLYLSVALPCDLALANSFHLVMASVTGITQVLRDYSLPVSIKWSNDLILENRKLGGIKIETRTQKQTIKYAVVGVGINWQNQVPEIGINLKSYYQKLAGNTFLQQITSLEELTAITIIGILKGYQDYLQLGINYTHQQYQKLLNSIGKKIIINNYLGIVTGVTPLGKLQVKLNSPGASTTINLSPGEISLGYD